jgi:hypothetical protein
MLHLGEIGLVMCEKVCRSASASLPKEVAQLRGAFGSVLGVEELAVGGEQIAWLDSSAPRLYITWYWRSQLFAAAVAAL